MANDYKKVQSLLRGGPSRRAPCQGHSRRAFAALALHVRDVSDKVVGNGDECRRPEVETRCERLEGRGRRSAPGVIQSLGDLRSMAMAKVRAMRGGVRACRAIGRALLHGTKDEGGDPV